MNMTIKLSILISCLTAVVALHPSYAGSQFTNIDTIKKGLSFSYQFRIKEAVSVFEELENSGHTSYATLFYPLAMQWGYLEEESRWHNLAKLFSRKSPPKSESKKLIQQILLDMNSVIKQCQIALREEPSNFEADFYLAGAFGLTARAELYANNHFSALSAGKKASERFDNLLKKYPDNGDAMLGAGAYRQNLGRRVAPLRFLLALYGVKADMKKGISLLKKSYELSEISKIESADILADIFISYKKDYAKGLFWAERVEEQAPKSFLASLHRVKAYRKMKDGKGVEKSLKEILQKIENYPARIKYEWQPLIYFALGVTAQEAGDIGKAKEYFKKVRSEGKIGKWFKREIGIIKSRR